ncbi:MAG TPA: hypothetical protein VJT15_12980 [Pyrinomonadaceae bacterium]|nr:hypothetical protein [Pyrinomonadaceae bacterium]
MQVTFEPDAEADLARARAWYGAQRDGLDLALMLRVDETLMRIVNAPYSYPVYIEIFEERLCDSFQSQSSMSWSMTGYEFLRFIIHVAIRTG